MKRGTSLLLLLAVSVAAGVWMFRPRPLPHPAPAASSAPAPPSCEDGDTCSAGIPVPATAPAVASTPPPSPPPAQVTAQPPSPVDGERLREDADRLLGEGKYAEGLAALRKATEADPSARNHGDLGVLLEKMTAIDEALIHLRAAADLDPANADRWIALANGYYRKVDLGAAWEAERRAREAEPGLVLGRDAGGFRVRKSDTGAGKQ